MLCSRCFTATKQYNGIGDTDSLDNSYSTYKVDECPKCKAKFVELYHTQLISEYEVEKIKEEGIGFILKQ